MSSHGRGRTRAVVAALLAASSLSGVLLAGSAAGADTGSEQREVKRKKAELASQIDTLQATDTQLDAALGDLQANVRATQAQMADATAEADAAAARAQQAQRQVIETEAKIEGLHAQVVDAAVDAYIDPEADQGLEVFLEDSADDASSKQALLDVTTGANLDVIDEYRSARQALDDQRAEAEGAQARAEQRRESLAQTKVGFETALAQQQQIADQVSSRINDKLAESQSLASLDQELSVRLAKEQAALAERLRAARVVSSGSGGASPSNGGGSTVPVITRPGLSTVRGVTVASEIAGQLSALLDAASAAGIDFGGGGYRDSSGQIALRRENCGSSDYAVYQMPPEQCRPATAIPGRSKHERGLAVDFTLGGRTLRSGDAGHQWMVANAASFGFAPLAGEPWHWSVGGG